MTRAQTPPSFEPPPRDQEKEELKAMLAAMEAEKERPEADAQAAELEAKIRGEAENALQVKLASTRRETEKFSAERELAFVGAQREIKKAKEEALVSAERTVAEERQAQEKKKLEEEALLQRLELSARTKIEAEAEASKQAQMKMGLRRIFSAG